MTDFTMELQFECDQLNKISLIRVEGLLTDKSLGILYESNRRHCAVTAALGGIVDLSSVREFALTTSCIQQLADQRPLIAEAKRSCIIVAPEDYAFGLCRMFQLMGEERRPLLQIVRTMAEAFAAIEIRFPHFASSVLDPDETPMN